MLKRIITTLCAVALFISIVPPAFGFLGVLDDLKSEFEAMESASDADLSDLLNRLEKVSGKGSNFDDIKSDDWFNLHVSSVARWGIVSGYKDANGNPTGKYGPADPVTIAEVLKMTLKAAQVDETKCIGVSNHLQARDHWAHQFVVCAEQRGSRLLGSSPDLNRPALRGEVLSILHDSFSDSVPPMLSTFRDTIDHKFESDIAYSAALGVVSGDKDASGNPLGTFRPDAPVNRAEAAKIIYEKLRVQVMGE